MAVTKDKIVTVESLSVLHEHNKNTYVFKTDALTMTNYSVTLRSDAWVNNEQTVEVPYVTQTNSIIVAPSESMEDYKAYVECSVRCVQQFNGKLTFSCEDIPDVSISVNLAIFNN